MIGYAVGSRLDGEAHLDQVSVEPSWRGHGIGRMLIEEVVAWGRTVGLRTLTLTTFTDVAWNGPYYSRLGFVALAPDELGPELAAGPRGGAMAGRARAADSDAPLAPLTRARTPTPTRQDGPCSPSPSPSRSSIATGRVGRECSQSASSARTAAMNASG